MSNQVNQLNASRTGRVWGNFGVVVVMVGATLACVRVASADPIRFDNPPGPDHFIWYGGTINDPSAPVGLDVTVNSETQNGDFGGPTDFHQSADSASSSILGADPGGQLALGGFTDLFLIGVAFGSQLDNSGVWGDGGVVYFDGFGSELPENEPTYLGVRFDLGAGWQYGWIGVFRQNTFDLDVFAWGYETEPGVPIAAGVPEPASMALLAMGACGVLVRRRRKKN
ncbi:MAG: PEP-CTERM sorting domain-containing protein [Phycisphaerales bacterium]|nr:PEP-CTERM sorting domain-containing protein [Phycisphaerales bacterium]